MIGGKSIRRLAENQSDDCPKTIRKIVQKSFVKLAKYCENITLSSHAYSYGQSSEKRCDAFAEWFIQYKT